MRKIVGIIVFVVAIALIGFLYWRYFFVYAEGTKAGVLNTIQKKGFLFKTYEGKIIQTGFSNSPGSAIQSNYFDFSVSNERVAKILMENSGREMELHYSRYLGALPWRGTQSYVVDSVYRLGEPKNQNAFPPQ